MTLYDLPAPAKINLFLHVVGQRPDGYHLLQTVFRFIDWCDTLHIECRTDSQIVCETAIPGLAPQDNLVVRAARLLQTTTGTAYGAQIRLDKHIPSGAGLGGGSSDAATTLIALNRLWKTGLSRSELMRLGLALGADVPVFIFGQPAFAEGVGELLQPLVLPDASYLVVEPAQKIETKAVFEAPDLTRDTPCVTIAIFTDWLASQASKSKAGSLGANQPDSGKPGGNPKGNPLFGSNSLQAVVCARYPAVAKALALLQSSGINARMSGSGSCVFAEFSTASQAQVQKQEIAGKMQAQLKALQGVISSIRVCSGLHDHPLRHWSSH